MTHKRCLAAQTLLPQSAPSGAHATAAFCAVMPMTSIRWPHDCQASAVTGQSGSMPLCRFDLLRIKGAPSARRAGAVAAAGQQLEIAQTPNPWPASRSPACPPGVSTASRVARRRDAVPDPTRPQGPAHNAHRVTVGTAGDRMARGGRADAGSYGSDGLGRPAASPLPRLSHSTSASSETTPMRRKTTAKP